MSADDITQSLKVVPSSVAYDIAGDYFQALHRIIHGTAAKFLDYYVIFERDANGLIRFNDLC